MCPLCQRYRELHPPIPDPCRCPGEGSRLVHQIAEKGYWSEVKCAFDEDGNFQPDHNCITMHALVDRAREISVLYGGSVSVVPIPEAMEPCDDGYFYERWIDGIQAGHLLMTGDKYYSATRAWTLYHDQDPEILNLKTAQWVIEHVNPNRPDEERWPPWWKGKPPEGW